MKWVLILFKPQEAEAFALYHKALDLQKHDRFEESAKAYHELLEIRLLREVSDLWRMELHELFLYLCYCISYWLIRSVSVINWQVVCCFFICLIPNACLAFVLSFLGSSFW